MGNRVFILLAIGFLMVFSGFIFHFQGLGEFGPQSSFMHRSPDWVAYGEVISALGVVFISFAVISGR
ncbi:MAG: hypothetical protein HZB68_02780 [Candidatus Aenigmarchaeota archaeon]|nr:hypothetical protein [Candidatus Aenigmarchaeota archaeon]